MGPELDAFIDYLSDDTMIGSDYVRRVDEAVRTCRDDPTWRRYRMLWSEKYRDDFAGARAKGREEGRAVGLEEGRVAGREEGRTLGLEEGRAAGREEGRDAARESIARLADRLEAVGRSGELVPALRNPERLAQLMDEFDIAD